MTSRWYVAHRTGGRQDVQGPLSFDHLRRLAAAGQLLPRGLVCREGTTAWQPAQTVEGLFPPSAPPPAPGKPSSWPLIALVTTIVAVVAGGGFLLLCLGCAGAALVPPVGPTPAPVYPNGGGAAGGGFAGGFPLQGTYQRRSNAGTAVDGYITFTADGRFEERGFLSAAAVHRQHRTPDGQVWEDWGDSQQGGQGTYRLTGSTLELTYSTGAKSQMNCGALDGSGQELLINTRYTFVRVR